MPARSGLITLSALLMQALPLVMAHPASGDPSNGFIWPTNWPGNSQGAMSQGTTGGSGGGPAATGTVPVAW
jgi:hypothetical protein